MLMRVLIFRNDLGLTASKMINYSCQSVCTSLREKMSLLMTPPSNVTWSIHCLEDDPFYDWFKNDNQMHLVKVCNGIEPILGLQETCQMKDINFNFIKGQIRKNGEEELIGISIGPVSEKVVELLVRGMNSLNF